MPQDPETKKQPQLVEYDSRPLRIGDMVTTGSDTITGEITGGANRQNIDIPANSMIIVRDMKCRTNVIQSMTIEITTCRSNPDLIGKQVTLTDAEHSRSILFIKSLPRQVVNF